MLMKKANPFFLGVILTETEFPYKKKGREPEESYSVQPPSKPPEPIGPPFPSPRSIGPRKFICPNCHKVFNTQEELTMHMETVHQSPKKEAVNRNLLYA